MFSAPELDRFRRDGYIVVKGLVAGDARARMLERAKRDLASGAGPLEYEADVRYPGAPPSREAPGGRTVRRLQQAYARDPVYAQWAVSAGLGSRLRQLLGPQVELSQAHHNCVMTKDPRFSSSTGWHRDVRYWSFEAPELVSVWLALGRERHENGCLLVLPGSHAIELSEDRLDEAQFLRADLAENRALLSRQTEVELDPGDVLFFDARLFHAAGRNQTAKTKFSLVFTYHAASNRPRPASRSASLPDIPVPAAEQSSA